MSQELPHASLQCSDCGTTFRVTLKKGRVPSRPIPCPKCKEPITVKESDIVHPGERRARSKTTPGDSLRKTKLASIDKDGIASIMDDPPTAEVPPIDPPTAEVELDEREIAAAMDEDNAPAFGILQKKKIGPKAPEPEDRKETPLGVDVAIPTGKGRRDNVFGERTSSSVAIGRISTRQVQSLDKQLNPDDPDLPGAPTRGAKASAKESPKKLDLSKLRKVMAKLEVESDAEEDFKNPLEDFDLDIDENVDDLIGEASDALESELNLISDAEAEPAPDDEPEQPVDEPEPPDEEPEDDASTSDPDSDSDSEFEIEMEPNVGIVEIESEAYEIGAAPVPARIPNAKRGVPIGGILVGIVVLVVFAALFWMMAM